MYVLYQLSQCKLSAPNWSRILTLGYTALRSSHCVDRTGDDILRKSAILEYLFHQTNLRL